MKGRETVEDLRSFLQNTIVPCFTQKYALLYKHRTAVKNPQDLDVWRMYQDQRDLFPNNYFISEGDVSRNLDRMLDKKMLKEIQMLRHLGIIKEERKGKTTFYIWVN